MLTISDKCGKILIGNLILQQFYVDGKFIRQTGGFGTIDFIYGALGGWVSGSGGTSAGAILAKFLKHPIKNLLADLSETLLMDFTNWYSQFVTEGVIDSYA